MAKLDITSQERSALRARAHPLRPVVQIGDRGLSESVLKEIDRNLTAHELIKVKVGGEDRDVRESILETICNELSCAPVHHLGKTLILFRPVVQAAVVKDPLATRAVRKPSEPYTPKKQAAAGAPRVRRKPAAPRSAALSPETAAPKARRAARSASKDTGAQATAAHGIPRRSGSALSLRAGARRSAAAKPPRSR